MDKKTNTKSEWISEMFKPLPKKPDGWFSINEISKITGENPRTTRYKVAEFVKDGKLLVMDCIIEGKASKCYKKK